MLDRIHVPFVRRNGVFALFVSARTASGGFSSHRACTEAPASAGAKSRFASATADCTCRSCSAASAARAAARAASARRRRTRGSRRADELGATSRSACSRSSRAREEARRVASRSGPSDEAGSTSRASPTGGGAPAGRRLRWRVTSMSVMVAHLVFHRRLARRLDAHSFKARPTHCAVSTPRARRYRMRSPSAGEAEPATRCSTSRSSARCSKHRSLSRPGAWSTTPTCRTPFSVDSRPLIPEGVDH